VYREIFEWVRTGEKDPAMLSAEARQQLEALQREPMDFGEGDRAFDDIVGDILAGPLIIEMRRLTRAIRGNPDAEEQERAVRRKLEIKAELKGLSTALARNGFKTTRWRAIPRVRADKPLPEQGE